MANQKAQGALRASAKRGLLVLAAAGVLALGGVAYYYSTRDRLPSLAETDAKGDGQAARVERIKGQVEIRPAVPEDQSPDAGKPEAAQSNWVPVDPKTVFKLGTLVRAKAQSSIELMTAGDWHMGFEGEGAFVLKDARRSPDNKEHVMSVYVQKGVFKAKAAYDDYHGYFMEITTAAAKVHVYEGEIGMDVNAQGKGHMWLMKGKAVAIWNDGRRKELGLRGLEDL